MRSYRTLSNVSHLEITKGTKSKKKKNPTLSLMHVNKSPHKLDIQKHALSDGVEYFTPNSTSSVAEWIGCMKERHEGY